MARTSTPEQSSESAFPSEGCFYSLDEKYRFIYVSRTAERLWDRSAESLKGKVIWDEFPTAKASEGYARHLAAMKIRRVESYSIFSPRFQRWYHFTLRPIEQGWLFCYFREASAPQPKTDEAINERRTPR